jgi:carboxylate-amine ligase
VQAAAGAAGHRIGASGSHPFSSWEDQEITDKPTYRDLAERYAHLADSTVINGCHVHVCIPDREQAVLTMNRMRRWLAPLLAVSASSPYWRGHDTGYASYRTEVFGRWPTAGVPEPFDGQAAYEKLLDQLIATGAIDKPARIYWHVRPSAKFDTLEVRVADVCTSIDDAVLVAGLARALVQRCHRDVLDDAPPDDIRNEVVRMAVWQAARAGVTGDLIDLETMRPAPAALVIDRLLTHVRDTSDDSDWSTLRDLAEGVLARGTSADRQRSIYDRTDSLVAVARWVADETLAGTG